MTLNDSRINRLKMSVTLVGASAAIAMGIIGVAATVGNDSQTAIVYAGSMTTGVTSTVAYSETEATSVAVPVVKATPFGEG
jgi:hypothetical protein